MNSVMYIDKTHKEVGASIICVGVFVFSMTTPYGAEKAHPIGVKPPCVRSRRPEGITRIRETTRFQICIDAIGGATGNGG